MFENLNLQNDISIILYSLIKVMHILLFPVCFSGEILCPGTRDTCRPRSHFCDLHTDCPRRTDEEQCCKLLNRMFTFNCPRQLEQVTEIIGLAHLLQRNTKASVFILIA